jgi:TATA-box binding protein (TBP) (component of TFIID and TFIIIB)
MIKLDCSFGLPVSLSEIQRHLPADSVDFDPERYHGLKVKWSGMKINVFRTGTFMIVPAVCTTNSAEIIQNPLLYVSRQLQSFLHFVVGVMRSKMSVTDCAYVLPKRV